MFGQLFVMLGDFGRFSSVFCVFSPFHILFPAQVKDPLLVSLHFSAISWPCFGTVHVGPGSWVVLPGSCRRQEMQSMGKGLRNMDFAEKVVMAAFTVNLRCE